MTKIELIDKLTILPGLIETAENEVIKATNNIQLAKDALLAKEDELLLSGVIDGKNVETRTAQMRANTFVQKHAVQQAENMASGARVGLNRLVNELAVCRAIADILRGCE